MQDIFVQPFPMGTDTTRNYVDITTFSLSIESFQSACTHSVFLSAQRRSVTFSWLRFLCQLLPHFFVLCRKKMPKRSYLYSRQFISSGSLLNLSSTIPPKLLKVINDIWLHPVVNAQYSSHLTCWLHLAWLFNITLSLFTFSTKKPLILCLSLTCWLLL